MNIRGVSNELYRVMQEERPAFWELIVSVIVIYEIRGVSNELYRVMQEERPAFWELIVSVIVIYEY